MRSASVRSVSFTFHKNSDENQVNGPRSSSRSCLPRQRLQDRFDEECPYSLPKTSRFNPPNKGARRKWSDFNISLPSVPLQQVQARRMLRSGADKISKTISNVRSSIDTLSQKFRPATKRRQRLQNQDSPQAAITPRTRSRRVLGRTPTKLYSPFGIDTPPHNRSNKENCNVGRQTPRRR